MGDERSKAFAVFAESCGLTLYPDPDGERYLYKLNGDCHSKKIEEPEFADWLWNALVKAKGGDNSLMIGWQ